VTDTPLTRAKEAAEIAEKATPAEWTTFSEDLRGGPYWTVMRGEDCNPIDIPAEDNGEADCRFISHARTSVPALAKDVIALTAKIEKLEAALEEARVYFNADAPTLRGFA
jgi:hypothetical protein